MKDMGLFFWPQVSEMSEMVTLKMGVNLAVSLNMGEEIAPGSCVIICKNAMAGHIPF